MACTLEALRHLHIYMCACAALCGAAHVGCYVWRRPGYSADVVVEVARRLPSLTSLELGDLIAKGDTGLAPLSVLSNLRRLAFTHQGAMLGAMGPVLPRLTALEVGGYGVRCAPARRAMAIASMRNSHNAYYMHACVRFSVMCAHLAHGPYIWSWWQFLPTRPPAGPPSTPAHDEKSWIMPLCLF